MSLKRAGVTLSMLLAVPPFVAVGGLTPPGLSPQAARACMIDLTPSILANGTLAVLNTTTPATGKALAWAPFRFRKPFAAGRAVRFSENARALAQVLPPEVVHGRWIWMLGDGTRAVGSAPVHRYARPGTYLITVAVALPHSTDRFTFDAAQVLITR